VAYEKSLAAQRHPLTEETTPAKGAASGRRMGRPLRVGLLVALIVLAALAGVYLARKIIVRETLLGWLDARGVPAELVVDQFEIDGFTGRVRIGPAEAPDFTVDRVEVAYGLRGFWGGRKLGVDVKAVRLVRPVVKGRIHGDLLSFGALDPLVEELRKHPPEPDATKPLILIETGRLYVETDYGGIGLRGDGRIEDGRLTRLSGRLDPARIAQGDASALIDGGRLDLVAKGDQIDFSTAILLADAKSGATAMAVRRAVLRASGVIPYPDLDKKRGDGGVRLNASLTADSLDLKGQRLQGVSASGAFEGHATGWIDTLVLAGPLSVKLAAGAATAGDLRLSDLDAAAAGQARWSRSDWRLQATASGGARGAWAGLGPVDAKDSPEAAALKRAARAFTVRLDSGRKLVLMRLYSGTLQAGDTVYNATRGAAERVARLFKLHAGRKEAVEQALAGEIVAAAGMKDARTGDTLCLESDPLVLERIADYRPVISVAIEPRNSEESGKLGEVLEKYLMEDPTLAVQHDEETGQVILSGMGELHLEVILERMSREFGLKPRSGKPQVVYQETVGGRAEAFEEFARELGEVPHYGGVRLAVEPLARDAGREVIFEVDPQAWNAAWLEAVADGVNDGLQSGVVRGYPVQDVRVRVAAGNSRRWLMHLFDPDGTRAEFMSKETVPSEIPAFSVLTPGAGNRTPILSKAQGLYPWP
jgi:hypothetical protein